jgi:hypothetical protein
MQSIATILIAKERAEWGARVCIIIYSSHLYHNLISWNKTIHYMWFLTELVLCVNTEVGIFLKLNITGSRLHSQWKQNGTVLYET